MPTSPDLASSSMASSPTFVAAYRRASIVIAPLVASAGTNIKVLEAMAMGKALVSRRGVNGLESDSR